MQPLAPHVAARLRRAALVLALLATLAALLGVAHRARRGQNALLKWGWAYAALERGESIYGTGPETPERPTSEGYPTLPFSLVVLAPFHALGPRVGPVAWATCCAALAWGVVLAGLRLAAGRAGAFPAVGTWLVLGLGGRVLYSELQHGNVNLLVGATVVLGALAWRRGRDRTAGVWFGVGAVLKVTPALALLWLVRARSGRGLAGFASGVLLAGLAVPALWLGPARTLELTADWWTQMVAPYLAGRGPTEVQAEHVNQSLYGVLARLATDAVAVRARPPVHPADVRVTLVALGPAGFRALHGGAAVLLLAWLWRALPRPGERRSGPRVLGQVALLALAMVFLSERSWKHHYVLLPLALAHLAWTALTDARPVRRAVAWTALGLVGVAFVSTGDALLGSAGADLAEAYGAYFLGGLAAYLAVGATLPAPGSDGDPCLAPPECLS